MLEGPHLLEEALEVGLIPDVVFVLERPDAHAAAQRGSEVLTVSERVMDSIATTQHPRGPVAVLDTPASPDRPGGAPIILWGVGDPGNLGTAIRSAAAFGVPVVVGPECADPWGPKVLRAGAGAHFRGDVVIRPDLTLGLVREWGFSVLAAVPDGGRPPVELMEEGGAAVLIGAEGPGLPADVIAAADGLVSIPMAQLESLNAGVAASILAYELGRP